MILDFIFGKSARQQERKCLKVNPYPENEDVVFIGGDGSMSKIVSKKTFRDTDEHLNLVFYNLGIRYAKNGIEKQHTIEPYLKGYKDGENKTNTN